MKEGKIIKGIAGFYYVYSGGSLYECKAKGIFRNRKIKPLVGDNVCISILSEEPPEGNIEEILPRSSELVRPAAANVDQAMILFAMKDPEPNLNLLDRFLVQMEAVGIPVRILWNKADLESAGQREALRKIYQPAGYPLHFISTMTGEGIPEVRAQMQGKTTVLAGPSGVGKSSLTNALLPEAAMETGSLSEKIRRGKHTTRHAQFFALDEETFFLDTPGFSSLFVEDTEPAGLQQYFPEFAPYLDGCRFQGCVHIGEKVCGVKQALAEGRISSSRYENYKAFYEELKDKKRF